MKKEDAGKGDPALHTKKKNFLLVSWDIPEKRWDLRTYFFENTTGISRFVTSPLKILGKI